MNNYQENGFESREDYLKCLAEDYGMEYQEVVFLANVFGEEEDFDGLVSALEDTLF